MRTTLFAAAALAAPVAFACPAFAAPGDPVKVSDTLTIDPIVEGRLRYEGVDQPTVDADSVTMRLRAGAELKFGANPALSLLFEGEGTLALDRSFNAFPFANASRQRRPGFAVVPDPENIDLNRLQLQYKSKAATITLGRQRINLDDQRWVGSVAWRQNEQTFDAVRAEAKIGPVSLDATYAINQHTIFGIDAGPRQTLDGHFIFASAAVPVGPVKLKAFSYLIDYHEAFYYGNSSQTHGFRATAALPLAPKVKLNLMASYARQLDYGRNPANYAADYIAGEAVLGISQLALTAGFEKLGSDRVAPGATAASFRAVQAPLSTLHKFQGWADLFLTTPAQGIQDTYLGASYTFAKVKALPGLNAGVIYHRFDSDKQNIRYGDEWNAIVTFKLAKRFAVLAKYANYRAKRFGLDTEKLWLQVEFAY